MKIYELIAELMKLPSGLDVQVGMRSVNSHSLDCVEVLGDTTIVLRSSDTPTAIDSEGEEIGPVSEIVKEYLRLR